MRRCFQWWETYVVGGNRGRPGSPGCHEESEARMVKVNLLPPAGLSKLLNPWPDPPTPLLLNLSCGGSGRSLEAGSARESEEHQLPPDTKVYEP